MNPDSTHAESIADALSRQDDVRSLHLFDDHAPSIVIDPGVVELRALERIHIGSNRSTDFDIVGIEALASVPTLRELSLNVNARVALPSAVFDLRRLERLHLRGPWASLPESLGSLGGLRHLDLSMHGAGPR